MSELLLKRREVERRTTLSTSTIYSLMREGEFPRPLRLGKQAVAWRESDVDAWIESRRPAEPEAIQ